MIQNIDSMIYFHAGFSRSILIYERVYEKSAPGDIELWFSDLFPHLRPSGPSEILRCTRFTWDYWVVVIPPRLAIINNYPLWVLQCMIQLWPCLAHSGWAVELRLIGISNTPSGWCEYQWSIHDYTIYDHPQYIKASITTLSNNPPGCLQTVCAGYPLVN